MQNARDPRPTSVGGHCPPQRHRCRVRTPWHLPALSATCPLAPYRSGASPSLRSKLRFIDDLRRRAHEHDRGRTRKASSPSRRPEETLRPPSASRPAPERHRSETMRSRHPNVGFVAIRPPRALTSERLAPLERLAWLDTRHTRLRCSEQAMSLGSLPFHRTRPRTNTSSSTWAVHPKRSRRSTPDFRRVLGGSGARRRPRLLPVEASIPGSVSAPLQARPPAQLRLPLLPADAFAVPRT
jgi:hypothetical protein